MISRTHRFHGHGSLRFVYQHGKTVRGTMSNLKYAPNPRRSTYRLAVVVSKKVSKSAVVRNRIRRRYYEAFRRRDLGQSYDMIVTVFDEKTAVIPASQLENTVTDHLKKANII